MKKENPVHEIGQYSKKFDPKEREMGQIASFDLSGIYQAMSFEFQRSIETVFQWTIRFCIVLSDLVSTIMVALIEFDPQKIGKVLLEDIIQLQIFNQNQTTRYTFEKETKQDK